MNDNEKTKDQLVKELDSLRENLARLEESEKRSLENRRKLEEELQKYRQMIDRASEAVFVVQDGGIKYANKAAQDITGFSLEETLLSNAISTMVHADDRQKLLEYHARRLQGDQSHYSYDARFLCKDGSVRWGRFNSSMIQWQDRPAALVYLTDITSQKQAEEVLRHSELDARSKLHDLLSPEFEVEAKEFQDIVDIDQLQSLMDYFYKLTNIGMAIIDTRGRVLVATGWQDICVKFHRKHPVTCKNCIESDLILSKNVRQGEYRTYKCRNNMWDIVSPIFAGGKHFANLFLGQFFFDDETPDLQVFEKQADTYGFDKDAYLEALSRVPRWSRETVENVMSFYSRLASVLGQLSFSNLKLARALIEKTETEKKLAENEQKYRLITEGIQDVFWMSTPQTDKILYVSPAFQQVWGRTPESVYSNRDVFFESIHPDDRSRAILELERNSLDEQPWQTSYRIIRPDGSVRWIEDRGFPIHDDHGKIYLKTGVARDITDLVIARQSLKHSDELYRSLFQNMTGCFSYHKMLFDEAGQPDDFVFLDVNLDFENFTGLRDIQGKKATEVIPDFRKNFPGLIERYARVASLGKPERLELYIESVNKFLDIMVYSPEKGYFCTVFQDITSRKLSEAALNESEEKFAKVFRLAPVMITLSSLHDGTFVDVNDKFVEVSGFSREEAIGKTSTELGWLSKHDRDLLLLQLNTTGCINETEIKLTSRDNSELICLGSGELIETLKGPMILSIAKDITQRKKMEESLRNSEKMLKTILAASPIGIALVKDREIVWINETGLKMFGYASEKELIGQNVRAMYPTDEEYSEAGRNLFSDVGKTGIAETQTRFVRKDGSIFHARIRSQSMESDSLNKSTITVISDITDQLRLEDEKETLRRQFLQAQKMEAMGNLAGGIAHDFNNLLQIILGYSEIILHGMYENEKDYPTLRKIHDTALMGVDLVKGLMTFGRKTETNRKPLNLNQEIKQISELLSRMIPKNISIELQLADDLHSVEADQSQFSQILVNLALNSRDAMPDGGLLEIKTSNAKIDESSCVYQIDIKPGSYVSMNIRDTGHGMDSQTLSHIFEPFFSTKEPGRGTGLGLATVYGIVKQHGGHITCYSEAGNGTVFTIYLPAISVPESVCSEHLVQENLPGNETILLVDDDDSVRSLGYAFLSRFGYEVLTASNGIEAMRVYKDNSSRISLIVLDIIMPEMDGKQFLSEIMRIYPDAKVIIASGHAFDDNEKRALSMSAKAFIDKPYKMSQLLESVRTALDQTC